MALIINNSKIIRNDKITDSFYLMTIENKNKNIPLAGQFISVRLPGTSQLLRRPFGVFGYSKKHIMILYKIAGQNTRNMSLLPDGGIIEYMGFLGNGWKEKIKGKTIWLAAGGIGLGGIKMFHQQLSGNNNVHLYCGFNSLQESKKMSVFLGQSIKKNLHLACLEKNKKFFTGNIVDLLKTGKDKPDMIIACGPQGMLDNLFHSYISPNNIPAYFSMENIMACGVGSCMGCNLDIYHDRKSKTVRVCKEGPVFNAYDIVWSKE